MAAFSNTPLAITSLPRAEEISLQSIEPQYKKLLVWQWMILWILVFSISVFIIVVEKKLHDVFLIPGILLALVLISIFSLWFRVQSFKKKAYAIREHDLVYRTGWLIQRVAVCPFNRIQHCSVTVSLLERRLGLASLSVFTAGSMGADIKIRGLKETDAARICDFILEKTKMHEQPGN